MFTSSGVADDCHFKQGVQRANGEVGTSSFLDALRPSGRCYFCQLTDSNRTSIIHERGIMVWALGATGTSMNQNHAGRVTDPDASEIFKGLKKNEIEVIRSAAAERRFRSAEIIVNAEQPARHFFLLKSGLVDYSVNTKDGRDILLRRLTAGDPFGFAALLSKPTGYLGTATSACETEALMWENPTIHQLTLTYPRLMENALRLGLYYIFLYAKRHIALVSTPARERVACVLTRLASRTGHAFPLGLEVEVKNKDLASMADVNSYSVSRFLKQWDRDGTLKKSRGKILLRSPEHLLS